MKPKYYRVEITGGASSCPVCGVRNCHLTGKHCGHLAKITSKGIAFYFWGWRPEGFNAQPETVNSSDV